MRSNLTESLIVKTEKFDVVQYADDTGILSLFSQKGIDNILEELDRFEMQSGLKVNYDKTSLYRMGSIRDSMAELYTAKPVAWTSVGITVLGVNLTYNNITKLNYESVIEKARNVMAKWGKRSLSLLGKVSIINTLIASLFVHKMTVLPNMDEQYVKLLESEFSKFIWSGKKSENKTLHTTEPEEARRGSSCQHGQERSCFEVYLASNITK